MDVFVRYWPQNRVREFLAKAILERLALIPNLHLWKVNNVFDCYHIDSKRFAEENASSEVYCVMDDDQLPLSANFFEKGQEALLGHPEYGMLAGFPLEYQFAGNPYAERKEEVIEAHAIGCPYFVKKGLLSFPPGGLGYYDGILSKVVTDQGLKTGFARKCLYNHLGYGFSSVEAALGV